MKEYYRTENKTLSIEYTIPETITHQVDSVIFNVYDILTDEYIQIDETANKTANVTAATGNGTYILYTADNNFVDGEIVTISGLTTTTGASLNKTNVYVSSATETSFRVSSTTVGTATGTQNGKAEVITNHFDLVLNTDVTAYDRDLKLELQIVSHNTYYEDEIFIKILRPYATPEEIAEYAELTIVEGTPGFGEITRTKLIKEEKRARLLIDSILSTSFVYQYKNVATSGQGTDILNMGQRIESFDKIVKDDEVIYDTSEDIDLLDYPVIVSNSKNNLKIVDAGDNISEWTDIAVLNNPGYFEKNSTYIVRGGYGWRYIPNDINEAVCELVADMVCNDFNYRKKGVKSISNDSYNVAFEPNSMTGNLIVDKLISGYKRFDLWAI